MQLQLRDYLLYKLELIANQQQRPLSDVLDEAVQFYLERQMRNDRSERELEALMREQDWLAQEVGQR